MKPKIVTLVLSLPLLDWTFSLSSGHSQDKVRLGYSGLGSGEEIHHLAKDLRLFQKHNVEVETIRITGGATIVQSIVPGELHFGRSSANEVVSAHLGGVSAKNAVGVN
jgi:ABC-type nitrate/sulfonate/bicarbonate transport system substrate-binding protein